MAKTASWRILCPYYVLFKITKYMGAGRCGAQAARCQRPTTGDVLALAAVRCSAARTTSPPRLTRYPLETKTKNNNHHV